MGRVSLQLVCVSVVAAALTGCSAYQAARTDDGGGHQRDGSYVLTASEMAQDCRGLQAWIQGYADSVRKLTVQNAAQQGKAPASIFSGLTRLSGQRESTSAGDRLCREYAIMHAMNRELEARRCETVDIDALLAPPEHLAAAPQDSGSSGKWGEKQGPTLADYRSASASSICGAR